MIDIFLGVFSKDDRSVAAPKSWRAIPRPLAAAGDGELVIGT
jgi:hypothetical protein